MLCKFLRSQLINIQLFEASSFHEYILSNIFDYFPFVGETFMSIVLCFKIWRVCHLKIIVTLCISPNCYPFNAGSQWEVCTSFF